MEAVAFSPDGAHLDAADADVSSSTPTDASWPAGRPSDTSPATPLQCTTTQCFSPMARCWLPVATPASACGTSRIARPSERHSRATPIPYGVSRSAPAGKGSSPRPVHGSAIRLWDVADKRPLAPRTSKVTPPPVIRWRSAPMAGGWLPGSPAGRFSSLEDATDPARSGEILQTGPSSVGARNPLARTERRWPQVPRMAASACGTGSDQAVGRAESIKPTRSRLTSAIQSRWEDPRCGHR